MGKKNADASFNNCQFVAGVELSDKGYEVLSQLAQAVRANAEALTSIADALHHDFEGPLVQVNPAPEKPEKL